MTAQPVISDNGLIMYQIDRDGGCHFRVASGEFQSRFQPVEQDG